MLRGPFSISLRLTAWFCGVFFLGWMLFGTAMWFTLKRTLKDERYQTLSRRMDRLQQVLAKSAGEDEADRSRVFTEFARATGNGLAEIYLVNGERAFPSPSAAASAFEWPGAQRIGSERFQHVISGGLPYWVLLRPDTLNGKALVLLAAAPESGNLVILDSFWQGLLAAAPVLLLVSSAGGYLMSRKALKPVDKITAAARSISIRNLSGRIPVTNSRDELQRLAETCNDMLGRLESAVSQIKQFTADASHELRGPLSFARTVSEVALRNPKLDAVSRTAFEDIVAESAKASELLEGMLTLARADAKSFDAPLEHVNLTDVVDEVCEMARPIAAQRQIALSISSEPAVPATMLGDFASLRRLVWILLDNALKYTPTPGRVDVGLKIDEKMAILIVSDTGIGIAPRDLPRIFDRFYRADPSRSQVEGSGLGLAIARWIAEMHHAELTAFSTERSGSTFQIAFPLCDQPLTDQRNLGVARDALVKAI